MSAKGPWDGTPATGLEAGGDGYTDSADADAEVAELAKRLRDSSLSSEGAGPSGSAPPAGGEGAGGAGAAAPRVWLRGWAYWWSWTDSAWKEGCIDYEANWCGTEQQFLGDIFWWWDADQSR